MSEHVSAFESLSPLALKRPRALRSVVGRPAELSAIEDQVAAARAGLSAVTLEGEPGLGKTRLLLAAADLAAEAGFRVLAVAADEELRGPFLLGRALLSCPGILDDTGAAVAQAVMRAREALGGSNEPGFENLPASDKPIRTYDLAALALRELAAERPVAILLDDVQWADEDSIRLLRYVIRTDGSSSILFVAAIRPEEAAVVTEAMKLVADMERLGIVRRLTPARFTQVETAEFLRQVLGGGLDPTSAATMHAQSEGVPFIIEELAHTYRESGMIQQIDGVWMLARNADRLVPSSVRTLISRRAAHVPDGTRTLLAEAAVLGRSFSLRDLRDVKMRLGDESCATVSLAQDLAPAVAAGLLTEHAEGSPADYTFTHDHVRELAATSLTPPRRRAIHRAIVEMLAGDGEPPAASLAMLAHHAAAAGDTLRCSRFALGAARAALHAHAPEETLRVVELGLPGASGAQERMELLAVRDDALDMLRRPGERLEGLAEMAALAEALHDPKRELEVMVRRAAAFRSDEEFDAAADIARRVRDLAAARDDTRGELAACIELGQALLQVELGEGFSAPEREVDLDGAQEAFGRAAELADRLGDRAMLAAATRELGVITMGRVRGEFVAMIESGALEAVIASGVSPEDVLPDTPVFEPLMAGRAYFERALAIFEELGDRRGVMSSIIGLAYSTWGADIHIFGAAQRIEDIRRLSTRLHSFARESDRAASEAQMLFGVQVFARAKGVPDLAIARGIEAHRAARVVGDRSLEFLSAGELALTSLELDDVAECESWIGRAAAVAASSPTPLRARLLETWRGMARAVAGDAAGMREHLEQAVRLATAQGRPAARCESLARLALESATLGAERKDEELLSLAERSAREAKDTAAILPGTPPWRAQANAALAVVLSLRGETDAALTSARAALSDLDQPLREDLLLDVRLAAAGVVDEHGTAEEGATVRTKLGIALGFIAGRMLDEDVRVRWFRSRLGQRLRELAAEIATPGPAISGVDDTDAQLLHALVDGRTNAEMAEELGLPENEVTRRLGAMYARLGVSSRSEATAFALSRRAI